MTNIDEFRLMKIEIAKIYFYLTIVLGLLTFSACSKEPHPAFSILSGDGELEKFFFSETGDTLLSMSLDADSVFSGRYKLWFNDSEIRIKANIDSNQLNGDFFKKTKGGELLKEGSFLNGEKHLQWRYFAAQEDTIFLKKEKYYFMGRPFGLRIDHQKNSEGYDFLLSNRGEKVGWGSFNDDRYNIKEGSLNFYDYAQIGNSSGNPDLVLFVAEIPGLEMEISILDEDEEEVKMRPLQPDGWVNGMWYFKGNSIKSASSLTVKTIDLKLLDVSKRDVYRDFIILPVVF